MRHSDRIRYSTDIFQRHPHPSIQNKKEKPDRLIEQKDKTNESLYYFNIHNKEAATITTPSTMKEKIKPRKHPIPSASNPSPLSSSRSHGTFPNKILVVIETPFGFYLQNRETNSLENYHLFTI